jgi:hypothetical protein
LKKKVINSEKKKLNIVPALVALFILFLFLVIGTTFSFLGNLSQPFDLSDGSHYNLDSRISNNVLFVNLQNIEQPTVYLVNFDPKNKQATILHFSNEIYTALPKDYGTWKLGSIYQLGQEEHPQIGIKLLKMSLSSMVGQPIDGVIISNQEENPQKVIESLRQNPVALLLFFTQIKTDLRPSDTFKYILSLSTIRPDKIEFIDLEKSSITKSQLLPDSSRVLGVDTIRFDLFVREKMADPVILEEGKSIAVFNATEHPGLAQEAARIITNLGGNVIITGNSESILDKSTIVSKDNQKGVTYTRLAEVFAPKCLKTKCVSQNEKITNSRAQVNVILGEDYYKIWYLRN